MRKVSYLKLYLNKNDYNISLNQKIIKKNSHDIFYITARQNAYPRETVKKIAFLIMHKKHRENVICFQFSKYLLGIVPNIFFLTFLSVWALLYFLGSVETIKYPNLAFLLSAIFIVMLLTDSYLIIDKNYCNSIYDKQIDAVYKESNKESNEKINFLMNFSPLNKEDSKSSLSTDLVGVIFGVLFTLYITLIFNKIYPVSTEIKTFINSEVTESLKNQYIQNKD